MSETLKDLYNDAIHLRLQTSGRQLVDTGETWRAGKEMAAAFCHSLHQPAETGFTAKQYMRCGDLVDKTEEAIENDPFNLSLSCWTSREDHHSDYRTGPLERMPGEFRSPAPVAFIGQYSVRCGTVFRREQKRFEFPPVSLPLSRFTLTFWEKAKKMSASNRPDAALDEIYREIDSVMTRGDAKDFWILSVLMRSIDPAQVDLDLSIGLLSASIPCSDKIQGRKDLLDRVRRVLIDRGEDPEVELVGL